MLNAKQTASVTHQLVYSPRAQQQLQAIYNWIAGETEPEVARRFVLSIYDYCDNLADFPLRGHTRDDLIPGMRIIGFRRRAVIAFLVTDDEVQIHGVYYGGSDYEAHILNRANKLPTNNS